MVKTFFRRCYIYFAVLVALAGIFEGVRLFGLPESVSVFSDTENPGAVIEKKLKSAVLTVNSVNIKSSEPTAEVSLFGLIPVKTISVNVLENRMLVPGGQSFGVKLFTKGVIIVGTTDIPTAAGLVNPAKEAGLSSGDIITSVNGNDVNTAEALTEIIKDSDGNELLIGFTRGSEEKTTRLFAQLSSEENIFKGGLWVRDSTAGIGTVTFVDSKTGMFGGLGHGICDTDTGELMPLLRGVVVDVEITGVIKGKVNSPGELVGDFGIYKKGELYKNTEQGVFGYFDSVPDSKHSPLPVGLRDELKEGKAYIYTTLSPNGPEKYEIQIEKIYGNSGDTKNFLIKITDRALLDITGGIVQGMSGSPIIQNGKLVGAVTHVLMNDPTRGYGIHIENMLKSENR